MERLLRGDDLGAAGEPCDLERGLVGFGAGVAEERATRVSPESEKLFGEVEDGLRRVQVRHVPELVELRGDGFDDGRVAVAEAVDGDAAEQIEVLLAVASVRTAPSPATSATLGTP